ncbi:MAG TPA: hypothetical protein PK069_05225 [Methanolinea sp.]|nr:hypothetical protein [Methanolinea sp.]HQK56517.1 hypothetical protein [Methanolinea sp.]
MTTTPRARPVEFEARDVLDSLGYHALNFNGSRSPINLVGIGDDDILLVQVRRERLPVRDIRDVNARYRADMDRLRAIGGRRCCTKEIWILSGREGFRYYEIFPGGLMEIERP